MNASRASGLRSALAGMEVGEGFVEKHVSGGLEGGIAHPLVWKGRVLGRDSQQGWVLEGPQQEGGRRAPPPALQSPAASHGPNHRGHRQPPGTEWAQDGRRGGGKRNVLISILRICLR